MALLQDVSFGVLGPLEVRMDGRTLPIRSPSQRRILGALLIDANRLVRTDRIVDVLWGTAPPPSAAGTLQSHLSRLRKTLSRAGDLIETQEPGYVLHAAPESIDAVRFEQSVKRARQARAKEAVAILEEALGWWRGPAWAEFTDDDFARPEAIRLEELRVVAIERRLDALCELGAEPVVAAEAARLAEDYPLRERPRELMMRALYRSGRHAEAVEAYRDFCEQLVAEMGVDPSERLKRLQMDILRHEASLARRNDVHLPVPATSFVGRDRESALLSDMLGRHRLVTLTGVGGVGKSRLALHVASSIGDRYPHGVSLCELAAVSDAKSVDHALATALGIHAESGTPVRDAVVDVLGRRRLLLLLDNCEHVIEGVAPLVDRVLRSCPGVVVCATSRERLGIDGECVLLVPPLETDPVRDGGAVALFRDRASAVRPDFVLSERNVNLVSEICGRLDGVPLAIELAAARTRSMSASDIAARLNERFSMLGPRRGATQRHRTLAATVEWSYRLLDETQRRLFDRLSVFAGGFQLESAEDVCSGDGVNRADVPGWLAGLVDKSMVVVSGSGEQMRYSLLETMRQYGSERLHERGEAEAAGRAHASYFVRLAEEAAAGLQGPEESHWVRMLAIELANLRVAHRWAMVTGDADIALRIPAALHFHALYHMRSEIYEWGERAAEAFAESGHPLVACVLASAGEGAASRGEFERAKELAERAMGLVGEADEAGRLLALDALAAVALFEGRLDECASLKAEVHACAGRDAFRAGSAAVTWSLSRTYAGDRAEGKRLAHEVRRAATQSGCPSHLAWADYCEGEALLDTAPARALAFFARANRRAADVGNKLAEGVALVSATTLRGRQGEPRKALSAFGDALAKWYDVGGWTHLWTTLRGVVGLFTRIELNGPATVLWGRVTTTPTAAPPFGDDAYRLAVAEATLRRRLGRDFEAEADHGRAMTDDETVAFARDEIHRALAELSPVH